MTIKLKRFALLLLTVASFSVNAQVSIFDAKKLSKIKEGKTYIMVQSIKFPGASQYLEQAQKNWTLSKGIDFLSPDHQSTLSPNDSFLALEAVTMRSNNITNIYYSLSLSTLKEKYFTGNRLLRKSDHEPVAAVALSPDEKAFDVKSFFKNNDFDGGGLLYNWSPGMLHNYLSQITNLLSAGKNVTTRDDIANKAQLAKLTTQNLYVPDFNLIRFSPFVGKLEKTADEERLFDDYKYPYKVITKAELDKMITSSDEPAYYLLFVKDSSSKIVCVVNSKTGETIYSTSKSLSYNLKSGDIKDLSKQIEKSMR
ncbi:hypothetical protein [Pedobacter frigidisoli]|uniref:hypothetical protein n=1 Tax=Pedobacter frigidisoli TaxID=2530455 RepID=UPI0029304355|nr:hypothetical protein [Pedobacter frigidisoli]